MNDLNALVNAIAEAGDPSPVRLRRGNVVSVQADGTCTVTIAGGSAQVSGVKVSASCCPIPNAGCWLATDGRDLFVLSTLAPYGPAYGSMRQSSAQTIGTGSFTAIDWTNRTETTSTGITLGATGITCVVPGLYRVECGITFAANATGNRHMYLTLNGSATFHGYGTPTPTSSDLARMNVSTTMKLAIGDVVNAAVYQSSGGNLATNIGAGHNVLRATWAGPSA